MTDVFDWVCATVATLAFNSLTDRHCFRHSGTLRGLSARLSAAVCRQQWSHRLCNARTLSLIHYEILYEWVTDVNIEFCVLILWSATERTILFEWPVMSVIILCPNGRRHTMKVTPNTTMSEVRVRPSICMSALPIADTFRWHLSQCDHFRQLQTPSDRLRPPSNQTNWRSALSLSQYLRVGTWTICEVIQLE